MSTPEPPADRHGVRAGDIQRTLQARLRPQRLDVRDDSHLHAGHAGAREGRHFSVTIVGACFEGLSLVARHRLIYDALSELMPRGIHALAIDARSPNQGKPP
jgi:BolA family transcriptional regulator, general stress-responsive regulator